MVFAQPVVLPFTIPAGNLTYGLEMAGIKRPSICWRKLLNAV